MDTKLALAELNQWCILIEHHLRQLRIAKDIETTKIFAMKLGQLRSDADHNIMVIKRDKKNCLQNKQD